MDSKSLSTCLLAMESVVSGLLHIKMVMAVCFFSIVREKIELCIPASKDNTVALFQNTIELRSKVCLAAVLK